MPNRTIKFRAWDGHKMQHDVGIYPIGGNLRFGTHDSHMFYRPNEAELMQFTGLLDKNGKEIYEHDLVTHSSLDDSVVGEVVFEKGAFALNGILDESGKDSTFFYNISYKDVSVVGNRFENPELLR